MITTTILSDPIAKHRAAAAAPPIGGRRAWSLALAFAFFACHGAFSFQGHIEQLEGPGSKTVATVTRTHGIIGYGLTLFSYLLVTVFVLRYRRSVLAFAYRFKALTALGVLALVSVLWSQDPARSAVFASSYLLLTLFTYGLVFRCDIDQLISITLKTGALLSLLSIAIVLIAPTVGTSQGADALRSGSWNGIFIDRTSAAKCFVFLLSPAIVNWQPRLIRVDRLLYIAMLSLLILQAHAVTSTIAVCAYAVFMYTLTFVRKHKLHLSPLPRVIGVLALICACICLYAFAPVLLEALGRDSSLTGRSDVWMAVLRSIERRPLLGYGFSSFWLGMQGESAAVLTSTRWVFGYAHNGVLEIWLQLGVVGVLLFVITLVNAVKDAWLCFISDNRGKYDWYIGLLFLTVIFNIDEETVVLPNELLALLYIVLCCGLSLGAMKVQAPASACCRPPLHVV
jgi:O-antigen ligase